MGIKIMTKTLSLAAALAMMGTGAMADAFTDQIVADLQAKGFTTIEVENGLIRTKAEAILGTQKIEVVWDRVTGEIVRQTWEPADTERRSESSARDSSGTDRSMSDDRGNGYETHSSTDADHTGTSDDSDDAGSDDGSDDDHGDDSSHDDHASTDDAAGTSHDTDDTRSDDSGADDHANHSSDDYDDHDDDHDDDD